MPSMSKVGSQPFTPIYTNVFHYLLLCLTNTPSLKDISNILFRHKAPTEIGTGIHFKMYLRTKTTGSC